MTIQDLKNKIENRRNMKTLKIEIPNGFEIDKENSTFEQIVFKEIEKQVPKTWEELKTITGFYIDEDSEIFKINSVLTRVHQKNVFATEEQAKASIALAQLSQLRDFYRNGWVPNWEDSNKKYCIEFFGSGIRKDNYINASIFLSFQDAETRDLFLENFKELIEQAKPLMS